MENRALIKIYVNGKLKPPKYLLITDSLSTIRKVFREYGWLDGKVDEELLF